jgi:SRSO17 transposase
MKTPPRLPFAPAESLPDLAEFLKPFSVQFTRPEPRHALDRYLTGLLTEHPNKNCDTLAAVVPGTSEQQLQGLLTTMAWDEDDLNRQRVEFMAALPTEGDGVLIFDDTGFAKQGNHSVGVARQYSGTLGKTGNCQVAVNCHYAERTIAWPVATRLYLPRSWATSADRLKKAGVPDHVGFRTKPEIALALLDQAKAWGVRWACVTADADYGDNPNFLAGLDERRQQYVVAVRADFAVATARRAAEPPQRADAVVVALPAGGWRSVRWREGSKGWLRGRFAAVRCWRVTADGGRHIGWLIGERAGDGKRRYYWSNFGPRVPLGRLVGYAHRRHWVEQFHEEAKTLLGWDQYQGRRWTGFHRHAVTVLLAYSFLVWREWKSRHEVRRRGRKRRPFSPSAGPAAGAAAGGPPPGERLAAAGSPTGVDASQGHCPVPPHAEVTKQY